MMGKHMGLAIETTEDFYVVWVAIVPEEDPGTLVGPNGNTLLSDFSGGVATGTDTIGSGHLSSNIQFSIQDVDHLPDGTTRVFTITLLSAMAGGDEIALHSDPASLSRSITITYDAPSHFLALTTSPTSIAENDSGVTATYTVTRTGPRIYDFVNVSPRTVHIAYDVRAGTAAAADFIGGSLPSGTFTYSDRQTASSFNIGIAGDNLNESSETFTIHFSIRSIDRPNTDGEGGFSLPQPLTVTIIDDDDITYAFGSDSSAAEGNSGGTGGVVRLPVTLSGATLGGQYTTITVPFTIDSGSTAGDGDYSIAPNDGNLQFDVGSGGSLTADIVITAVPNNLNEADKTVIINLGPVADMRPRAGDNIVLTATVADQSATATITDDDAITVTIAAPNPATVEEGATAEFSVTLTGDPQPILQPGT